MQVQPLLLGPGQRRQVVGEPTQPAEFVAGRTEDFRFRGETPSMRPSMYPSSAVSGVRISCATSPSSLVRRVSVLASSVARVFTSPASAASSGTLGTGTLAW